MNALFSHPIEIIVGALLWPTLVAAGFGIRYAYRRLFVKYPLEGDWHCYHRTLSGGEVRFVHRVWQIRKGIRHKYCGSIRDGDSGRRIYRLSVDEENGTFLFLARSLGDPETFYVRTRGIFFDDRQPIFGLHVALNFDSKIYGGVKVLTRSEISEDQVEDIIQRNFENPKDQPLMVVNT